MPTQIPLESGDFPSQGNWTNEQLKQTRDTFLREVFWPSEDQPIETPERFAPDPELMARHRELTLNSTEVQA